MALQTFMGSAIIMPRGRTSPDGWEGTTSVAQQFGRMSVCNVASDASTFPMFRRFLDAFQDQLQFCALRLGTEAEKSQRVLLFVLARKSTTEDATQCGMF